METHLGKLYPSLRILVNLTRRFDAAFVGHEVAKAPSLGRQPQELQLAQCKAPKGRKQYASGSTAVAPSVLSI